MQPTPRFIQICTSSGEAYVASHLYGLTEDGKVYEYSESGTIRQWRQLKNVDLIESGRSTQEDS